jgi:hypothetical protein
MVFALVNSTKPATLGTGTIVTEGTTNTVGALRGGTRLSLVDLALALSPTKDARRVRDRELDAMYATLPRELVDVFATYGEAGCAAGLFWLVRPRTAAPLLAEWLRHSDDAHGFLRSAFGDVYCWRAGVVTRVSVHTGVVQDVTSDLERFFSAFLRHPRVRRDTFLDTLVAAASRRLGALSQDDAFAFAPALSLRPVEEGRHVVRVDWLGHGRFLAGLARAARAASSD